RDFSRCFHAPLVEDQSPLRFMMSSDEHHAKQAECRGEAREAGIHKMRCASDLPSETRVFTANVTRDQRARRVNRHSHAVVGTFRRTPVATGIAFQHDGSGRVVTRPLPRWIPLCRAAMAP